MKILILASVGLILLASTVLKAVASDTTFSEGTNPFGKPLEYWAKEYWKWIMTVPKNDNNECKLGSDPDGRMVFLVNSIVFYGYNGKCEISSKQAILVPLLISECDRTVGEERLQFGKIEEFWDCAREANDGFNTWTVTLDNTDLLRKVNNVEINRDIFEKTLVNKTSFFNLTIPTDNPYEITSETEGKHKYTIPGTFPAVVAGYYLVLKPLSPGNHVISYDILRDKKDVGVDPTPEFGKATYDLTVK